MGASVGTETGAFHNPVGNSQLEKHHGSVGLPPGPPLAHIGRRRSPSGKAGVRGAGQEIPARERVQELGQQALGRPRRRVHAATAGSPGSRVPARVRRRATSARMAVAAVIDVRGGGEAPQRQPQASFARARYCARASAARNSARGWRSCRRNPRTARSPGRPVMRLSPSTPGNDTLMSPGTRCSRCPLNTAPGIGSSSRHSRAARSRACAASRRAFCSRERGRHSQPDDLVRGQRAGTQAALVSAAELDRRDFRARAFAHVQRADALRSVELVRGQRQEIDAELLDIDRQFAHGLRRVGVHAARRARGRSPQSRRCP